MGEAKRQIPAWVPAHVPAEDRIAFKSSVSDVPCLRGNAKRSRCGNHGPRLVLRLWAMEDGRQCLSYFCETCSERASGAIKQSPSALSRAAAQQVADMQITATSPMFDKESPERTTARCNAWNSTYSDYLKSAIWSKKRREILERDKYTCCVCGKEANRVHHLSYENVDFKGSEPPSDLVSVCDGCHEAIHKLNPIERHFEKYGWWSKANWFSPSSTEPPADECE